MSGAKEFFAGLYQESPKPVLVLDEKERLIYSSKAAELLAARLGIKQMEEIPTPAVLREGKRCLRYYRGASVPELISDYSLLFFLTPYPYNEDLYLVVTVEEKNTTGANDQDVLHVLRNSQGKLNSYLNGIYAQAQILGLDSREGRALGDDVRRILRLSNHLYQLLDREDVHHYMVPVNAGRFAANCVATANDIDSNAQILMRPFESDIFVRMMPEEAELVLSTLISNAMRFRRSLAMVSVTRRDGRVYITVTDDGPGVQDPELLFTWGYRTPDKYGMKGLGTGLVMAKKLLELQGASLEYERAGNETMFHMIMNEEPISANGRLAEWHPETLENSLSQMQIELSDYVREETEE